LGVEGLEPSRLLSQQILSLLCLPFHHTPDFLGDTQIRTGDRGFAIHCLTTWPYRHLIFLTTFIIKCKRKFEYLFDRNPILPSQIKELINLVDTKYDFIFIDAPAGIDEGFQTVIVAANEAIVIVIPEVPSIRDADKVIGLLIAQNIRKVSLLVNRIRPKMVKTDDMMSIEDVKNILGIRTLTF
jgi:hypothetical protein